MKNELIITKIFIGSILLLPSTRADEKGADLFEGYSKFIESEKIASRYFDKMSADSSPISAGVLAKESEIVRTGYELYEVFWNPTNMNGLKDHEGKLVESRARWKNYLSAQNTLNVVQENVEHLSKNDELTETDSEIAKPNRVVIRDFRPRINILGKKVFYLTAICEDELSNFLQVGKEDIKSKERFVEQFLAIEIINKEPYLLSDPIVQTIYFNEKYTESRIEFKIGSVFGVANYELKDKAWKLREIYCIGYE